MKNLVLVFCLIFQSPLSYAGAQVAVGTPASAEMTVLNKTARTRKYIISYSKYNQALEKYEGETGQQAFITDLSSDYDALVAMVVTTKASRFHATIKSLIKKAAKQPGLYPAELVAGWRSLYGPVAVETKRRLVRSLIHIKPLMIKFISEKVLQAESVSAYLEQQQQSAQLTDSERFKEIFSEIGQYSTELLILGSTGAAAASLLGAILLLVEPSPVIVISSAFGGFLVGVGLFAYFRNADDEPMFFDFSRTSNMDEILYSLDLYLKFAVVSSEAKLLVGKLKKSDSFEALSNPQLAVSSDLQNAINTYVDTFNRYVRQFNSSKKITLKQVVNKIANMTFDNKIF